MADCIDWQITEKLIQTLQGLTAINGYNTDLKTVELLRATLSVNSQYPKITVVPNEIDPDHQYLSRNDFLPFVLIYSDGLIESDTSVSYIERYKNVAADVQKILKTDPALGGLCSNLEVTSYGYTVLQEESYTEEILYLFVSVERMVDASDPYQLA